MEERYANVLGTEYKIEMGLSESQDPALIDNQGYCDCTSKAIRIREYEYDDALAYENPSEYLKATVRHELVHAFLAESGLQASSWADNEEMVDWIAIQFPKLLKVFKELDVL